MDRPATTGEGEHPLPDFRFKLVPTHNLNLLDHVRSSVSRALPEVKECARHDGILSIMGGGPSLEDTWKELEGYIATVNGSLGYLLSKGIVPHFCGICHPTEEITDIIETHPDVAYWVASHCHPKLFDKLINAGCNVSIWHNHPIEGLDALLTDLYPQGWMQMQGGCTMGLRWLTLGYLNGFRKFHLHGMDSSFRGKSSHAYPDHQDAKDWVNFDGYPTRINFIAQVVDFIRMMEDFRSPDKDPTEIKMFGDGLLQKRYRDWKEEQCST